MSIRKGAVVFNDSEYCRSRTKQSFSNECDINSIVKRASKTGFLVDPLVASTRRPFFGDFSNVDFRGNLNAINSVSHAFMQLPAEVRSRFNNDPANVLDFIADASNADEARKLGLLPPLSPEQMLIIDQERAAAQAAAGQVPNGDASGSTPA